MLYMYSSLLNTHSKYSGSNISMNSVFQLVNSSRGESYWLIPNLAHFVVDLVTSWKGQVLLYAYSKCVGSH